MVPPRQRRVRRGAGFGPLDGDHDVLEQRAQQFLFVARRGGRSVPDASEIVTERTQTFRVGGTQCTRALGLATGQFALGLVELPPPPLPVGFEAAGHQPILGLRRAIAALGAFGFVACPFDGEAPLRERRIMVGVELLRGHERGVEGGRREGGEEGRGHGRVDLESPDVEAVDAPSLDEVFARTVIPGRGIAAVASAPGRPASESGILC
jgi:hypothetical protein